MYCVDPTADTAEKRYAGGMNMTRASSRRPHRRSGSQAKSPGPPPIGFKAFIAYADLAAARQAMSTINEVLRAARHAYRLEPMLWRFDQLAAEKWREPALCDAAKASVVVLAQSASVSLPVEMERWVGEFLARQRHARTTLVALLGNEDAWTISLEGPAAEVPAPYLAPATTPFPPASAVAPRAA